MLRALRARVNGLSSAHALHYGIYTKAPKKSLNRHCMPKQALSETPQNGSLLVLVRYQ